MCHWRQVRNVYTQCGHAVNMPDEEIKCGQATCKFSPAHPPTCRPPDCSKTCWQYHQYPEQYSPNKNTTCPSCLRKAENSAR